MNSSSGQQCYTPADLRKVVTEVLQSEEFCNQLRCSINRATCNTSLNNLTAGTAAPQTSTATPTEELRRLFPSIRGSRNNEMLTRGTPLRASVGHTSERRRTPKRPQTQVSLDFKRDVILVKTNRTTTLTGTEKGSAYANGYAISAATFQKTWIEQEIFSYIEGLFKEKLHGIQFEILVPISRALVKPNLPEGTAFDGSVMCRIFAQKIVYVRPLSEIVQEERYSNYEADTDEHIVTEVSSQSLSDNLPTLLDDLSSVETRTENYLIQFLDNDVETAITRSIEDDKNNKTLIEVLKELHNQIDIENCSHFNVYREDIFNCCIRALRRKNFSPLNRISVLFTDINNVSEGAVDMGGPTREMFTLLMKYLANSMLFEGPTQSKNITLYNEHLELKHYYEAGRIISLSLIHGGPGPQFFSDTLFNYLVYGVEGTKPHIEEVMNLDIRKELENIREAPNLLELQQMVLNSTFLTIAGFCNVASFDRKEVIVDDAIKYYVIHRTMPALQQFEEGINIVGLLDKLKKFKDEFRQLMCYTNTKLSAAKVSSIFTVNFSEIGSNKRNIESRIFSFWEDYLLDCEEKESEATLEDVLRFTLACDKIPPLGFDNKPQVDFIHNEEFFWPKANTCALILFLPVSYKNNEYQKFRKNMDFAIMNGMQFGFA